MIARGDIWEIARQPGVLTDKQLRVLELKELHGFSWNQIVATLNIDRSTAVAHYRAARRKLLNHLEQLDKELA